MGKSAQLPLQTWLPDAMAGPTPVSALIHAATMVTAGVYLIARTYVLFALAPDVRLAVAIIGTVTLLYAGFSALAQRDIKRVLAYSTISQIGYMFLALGVAGWDAAIFHFMTHAFFKALLFLGAGVVIEALADEHDIFKMGGLRRELPVVFWTFLDRRRLAGGPAARHRRLLQQGPHHLDQPRVRATAASGSGPARLAGACLTGLYAFRLVFVVFFGEQHTPVTRRPRWRMQLPLVRARRALRDRRLRLAARVDGRLGPVRALPRDRPAADRRPNGWAFGLGEATIVEVALAARHRRRLLALDAWRDATDAFAARPVPDALERYWRAGWGFDWLYEYVFVRPGEVVRARGPQRPRGARRHGHRLRSTSLAWRALSASQNGLLRLYIGVAGVGLVVILAFVVLR